MAHQIFSHIRYVRHVGKTLVRSARRARVARQKFWHIGRADAFGI